MGHPKKQEKKYSRPKRPYNKERLEREKKLKQEYGLHRKKEIWRAEAILRNFRRRARELQAHRDEKKEQELISRLSSLGLRCGSLDDALDISLENILSRRLQTVVYKKGIANSARHARQLIVHGHIIVDSRKIRWPSYIVESGKEDRISLSPKIKMAVVEQEKATKAE